MKPRLLFMLLSAMFFWSSGVQAQWSAKSVQALDVEAVMPWVNVLGVPSIENALLCKAGLDKLSLSQSEPLKTATAQLSWLVHYLFYGEVSVINAKKAVLEAERKAKEKDGLAAASLKRNGLGHKDKVGHDNAAAEARRFRAEAKQALEGARDAMLEVVRTMDAACLSYREAGHGKLAARLEEARLAVVGRCLKEGDFTAWQTGRFNQELLAGLAALGLDMTGKQGSKALYDVPKKAK